MYLDYDNDPKTLQIPLYPYFVLTGQATNHVVKYEVYIVLGERKNRQTKKEALTKERFVRDCPSPVS